MSKTEPVEATKLKNHTKPLETETTLLDRLLKNPSKLIEGTLIGLIARFVAWPLERTAYDKMAEIHVNPADRKPYLMLLRNNLQIEKLLETASIFKQAGFIQTIGKSLSNVGMWHYVNSHPDYQHLSPTEKGMKTALYCSFSEAVTTAPGEYKKFKLFRGESKELNYFSFNYGRIFTSTLMRSLWSSHILYVGIYKTEEELGRVFPSHIGSTFLSASATVMATFIAQIPIMLSIHFQNYIYENQQQSFGKSLVGFYQKYKIKDWSFAWKARGINRGFMNLINVGGMAFCHRFFHHQHPTPQTDKVENQPQPKTKV